MAESIRKVVVTWSDWADLIPERSRLEGYEDLEFVISEDKDEIVSGLADADAALIGAWDADMLREAAPAAMDTRGWRWREAVPVP